MMKMKKKSYYVKRKRAKMYEEEDRVETDGRTTRGGVDAVDSSVLRCTYTTWSVIVIEGEC